MSDELRKMVESAMEDLSEAGMLGPMNDRRTGVFLSSIAKSLAVLATKAIEEPPVPVFVPPLIFKDAEGNEISMETILPDLSGPPGSIPITGTLDLGVPIGSKLDISAAPPGAFGVAQTRGIDIGVPAESLGGKIKIGGKEAEGLTYEFNGPVEVVPMPMRGGTKLALEGMGIFTIKEGKGLLKVQGPLRRIECPERDRPLYFDGEEPDLRGEDIGEPE